MKQKYNLHIDWFYVGRFSSVDNQYNQLSVKMGLMEARAFKDKMADASPNDKFAILGVFEEVNPEINTDSEWLFK